MTIFPITVNDEQMSNWVGVEHQPYILFNIYIYYIYRYLDIYVYRILGIYKYMFILMLIHICTYLCICKYPRTLDIQIATCIPVFRV